MVEVFDLLIQIGGNPDIQLAVAAAEDVDGPLECRIVTHDYIISFDSPRVFKTRGLLSVKKALEAGNYSSQAALAWDLGVSRVRVTQVLRLLRLAPKVLEKIADLGDPLTSPTVTERKLRPLVNLPIGEQRKRSRRLLSRIRSA